jgi:cell division protein FtsI (penicillin-binding protein 3)
MSLKTCSQDRFRLVCLLLFQTFLFSAIIARFYKVQILEGEKWEKVAENQHRQYATIPYKRGTVYSNTSLKKGVQKAQPFAIDIPKFHIYIDPLKIPDHLKEKMIENLLSSVHVPFEDKKKVREGVYKKTHYRKIFSFVDRLELDEILAWWKPFYKKEKLPSNALFYSQEYERCYPLGSCLGQVLHTVLKEKDPETNKAIPTGGLELILAKDLEGKQGKKCFAKSAINALDVHEIIEEKEDGSDVHLTVNHYIQAICEEELKKGIEAANAKGGWAILMNPYNGEVLALAQYPFFSPSNYQEYFNNPVLEEHTKAKAVTEGFEPASIFKPIIVAICMKANDELISKGMEPLFDPDEKIATDNGNFPGRSFPLKDGRRRKYMNMDMALQKSGNVYMGKLMQRLIEKMGDQWLKNALEEFGFGEKTHIEMPAESKGVLPTPGKCHPNGTLEWSKPTPYSLAIGHNLLVNTMQMAVAYSVIANGGYKIAPTLIKKIENKESTSLNKPPMKKILKSAITNRLTESLKYVTKPGGSANNADIFGYTEAGKTGTSEKIVGGQYSREHYISSFIGFAPAKDPKFVLIVVVDEPEVKRTPGVRKNYLGGACAAPIFPKISKRVLQYLGVAPDDPFGYPYKDPRRDTAKADMTQKVKELRKLDSEWNPW